jgi:tRNA nucleotidyltransferase/poly(A) polymerase
MSALAQQIEAFFQSSVALTDLVGKIRQGRTRAWLVGGAIRDLLLQRPLADVDIATDGDPTELAKSWAAGASGRWFWLDAERRQSRVLLPKNLVVDFAPLRAASIEEDLLARDFTLNSLAYPLHATPNPPAVLDLFEGRQHIRQHQLALCSERSFITDPLRLLKGIRHAVILKLQFAPECFAQMQLKATLIRQVPGERLRDELGKILAAERAVDGIRMMLRTGLLAALFGPAQASWHEGHALDSLQRLQDQIRIIQKSIEHELDEEGRDETFPQKAIFLLAKLLELYSPHNLPDLLHKKLRLSRQQQKLIQSLQQNPGSQWLARAVEATDGRQQALLVEQLGFAPIEQLIYLSLTEDELVFKRAILLSHAFRQHQVCGRVPDLIKGERLESLLQGRPKHEIGIWQNHLKLAEIAGKIGSASDADQWLNEQLSI